MTVKEKFEAKVANLASDIRLSSGGCTLVHKQDALKSLRAQSKKRFGRSFRTSDFNRFWPKGKLFLPLIPAKQVKAELFQWIASSQAASLAL
jgi:hypothetical protein